MPPHYLLVNVFPIRTPQLMFYLMFLALNFKKNKSSSVIIFILKNISAHGVKPDTLILILQFLVIISAVYMGQELVLYSTFDYYLLALSSNIYQYVGSSSS